MQKPIQLPYLVAILLVVLLIAPFGLLYVPETMVDGFFWIFSLTWGFHITEFQPSYFGLPVTPVEWGFVFLLSIFRFPFAYIVLRYWRGQTTKSTFYFMGVVSFLPLLVYSVGYSSITGIAYVPFIPIPFLLIVGVILKRIMVTETQEDRDTKRKPELRSTTPATSLSAKENG